MRDRKNLQSSYLDLEDSFLDSEVTLRASLIVKSSFRATQGQDGSQDFALNY